MSDEFLSVPDMLAKVTAQMDQVQAEIDNARLADMVDQEYQLQLDRKQDELNQKRGRVRLMKDISDIVYPK